MEEERPDEMEMAKKENEEREEEESKKIEKFKKDLELLVLTR